MPPKNFAYVDNEQAIDMSQYSIAEIGTRLSVTTISSCSCIVFEGTVQFAVLHYPARDIINYIKEKHYPSLDPREIDYFQGKSTQEINQFVEEYKNATQLNEVFQKIDSEVTPHNIKIFTPILDTEIGVCEADYFFLEKLISANFPDANITNIPDMPVLDGHQ